jgi:hypothetical protein
MKIRKRSHDCSSSKILERRCSSPEGTAAGDLAD